MNISLKVSNQITLNPKVAASILEKFVETSGTINNYHSRKGLALRIVGGEDELFDFIHEIEVNKKRNYLMIRNGKNYHYFSLGAFIGIFWQLEK